MSPLTESFYAHFSFEGFNFFLEKFNTALSKFIVQFCFELEGQLFH